MDFGFWILDFGFWILKKACFFLWNFNGFGVYISERYFQILKFHKMKENITTQKSYAFALKTVGVCRLIMKEHKEFVLSKQLLRSATSVGANIAEAQSGQSLKDFVSKLSISYKEANESHYWIRLLRDSELMEYKIAQAMLHDCNELLKIIGSIIKTCKAKIKNESK
ncbi:MAG: four helix bundle protein [Saprospiraceae bacterium]